MRPRMHLRSALRASVALTEADLADQAERIGATHPVFPRRDAADEARSALAEFSPVGSGAGDPVDQAAMNHVEGR